MAIQWLRLWHDMPNDPKWRTIARASHQPISSVLAVYLHILVAASNANERGRTRANTEDIGSALDLDGAQVAEIIEAMQGRVLDGDLVMGWDKRQVEREDGAAARAKAWREAKKEAERTQANATERKRTPDKDKDKDKEKIETKAERTTATRLPADWIPSYADARFCADERKDLNIDTTASRFRDYWIAQPGAKGRKVDWPATWRNWVRNEKAFPARASPGYQTANDKAKSWCDELLGVTQNDQRNEFIDIPADARFLD